MTALMITRFTAAIFFLFVGTASATPDRWITTSERLLGSNGETYAILRTEHDNRGSYYISRTKVFLIERSAAGTAEDKSVLVSETETVVDAAHNDPKTPPPVTTTVISRDDGPSLADTLLRFPISASEPWTETAFARLSAHPASGISLDGRVRLANPNQLKELFGTTAAEGEWKLTGALEQGPFLFFTLETDPTEAGTETRILGVGADLAEQARAHLKREDIYLSAGSFATREEALAALEAWVPERDRLPTLQPWEIWSRQLPTGRIDYVLVLERTKEMLDGDWAKRIETELGIRFEAISSSQFQQWFPVW